MIRALLFGLAAGGALSSLADRLLLGLELRGPFYTFELTLDGETRRFTDAREEVAVPRLPLKFRLLAWIADPMAWLAKRDNRWALYPLGAACIAFDLPPGSRAEFRRRYREALANG